MSFHLKVFIFCRLLSSLDKLVLSKIKASELAFARREGGWILTTWVWNEGSLYGGGWSFNGATWRVTVSESEAPRTQIWHPNCSWIPTVHWMASLYESFWGLKFNISKIELIFLLHNKLVFHSLTSTFAPITGLSFSLQPFDALLLLPTVPTTWSMAQFSNSPAQKLFSSSSCHNHLPRA